MKYCDALPGADGPVLRRLRSFGPVVGLVVGLVRRSFVSQSFRRGLAFRLLLGFLGFPLGRGLLGRGELRGAVVLVLVLVDRRGLRTLDGGGRRRRGRGVGQGRAAVEGRRRRLWRSWGWTDDRRCLSQ